MNYTIENGILTITISTKGGEMQSIKTKDGTEYLWQGSETTWPDRAPNIFPYVGRLQIRRMSFKGNNIVWKSMDFFRMKKWNVL